MAAYSLAVIQRCHKRNVHAMGGMAAQIPIKGNEAANETAFNKVRADKEREVKNGHDGTWVAHPGLVPVAMEIFNKHMTAPNQISNKREDVHTTEEALLEIPKGTITEKGVRENINVGILYIESWLSGRGAAAIYNLMEDAATAEISRTQIWQWLHAGAKLEDGRIFTKELYDNIREEEIEKIKQYTGEEYYEKGNIKNAVEIFNKLVLDKNFEEFLTLEAYKYI
jgi:malate synthase